MSAHTTPTKEGRNEADPIPVYAELPAGEASVDINALAESKAKGNDAGGQAVTFEHVNSLKEAKLHAGKTETLSELWERACFVLGEPRRTVDRLQTADGKDVTPYLGLSLSQLREQGIKDHKFEILGPTGGA